MQIKTLFFAFLLVSLIATNDCCRRSLYSNDGSDGRVTKTTRRTPNYSFDQGDNEGEPFDKKDPEKQADKI